MGNGMGFYFALWCEDKRSLQATRIRNIMSDVNAGHSPFSTMVSDQISDLERFDEEYNHTFEMFSHMTVSDIDKWCKEDLLKRGAIEE